MTQLDNLVLYVIAGADGSPVYDAIRAGFIFDPNMDFMDEVGHPWADTLSDPNVSKEMLFEASKKYSQTISFPYNLHEILIRNSSINPISDMLQNLRPGDIFIGGDIWQFSINREFALYISIQTKKSGAIIEIDIGRYYDMLTRTIPLTKGHMFITDIARIENGQIAIPKLMTMCNNYLDGKSIYRVRRFDIAHPSYRTGGCHAWKG